MYASGLFITHIPQSKMTSLSASSFHWLPGEDSCWSSSLHALSSFHYACCTTDPTASDRHLMLRVPQASSRTHPAFAPPYSLDGTRDAPPYLCAGVAAMTHNEW